MKTGFALSVSVSAVRLAFSPEEGTHRAGWLASRMLGGLGVGGPGCAVWDGVEVQVASSLVLSEELL